MDHVINWLWQGAVVATLTTGVLSLMERTRAQARYTVCWLALIAITALPVLPSILAHATPAAADGAAVPAVLAVPAAWWSSWSFALLAGALWVCLALARIAADLRAARRLRAGCTSFPAQLESHLRCWNAIRTRGRRAALMVAPNPHAASVIGAGRPVIAIAPALLSQLGPDEIDRVVVHEWAHVQRRDDQVGIAHAIVRVIAGWHPAVWWVERRMLVEREIACDETAVAVTGCAKRYAACLTSIAALSAIPRNPRAALGVLSTPALSRRVTRILSRRKLASPVWSAGAAMLAVVLLASGTLAVAGHRLVETSLDSRGDASEVAAAAGAGFSRPPIELGTGVKAEAVSFTANRTLPADQPPLKLPRFDEAQAGRALVERRRSADAFTKTEARSRTIELVASAAQPAVTAPALRPVATWPRSVPLIDQPALPARPAAPRGERPSPWIAAADAGVSVGRGSQQAGIATAKFFTRVGKKIAGSF
jgi:beta-lactamase regulating signal transducer with metallopeptidase domain